MGNGRSADRARWKLPGDDVVIRFLAHNRRVIGLGEPLRAILRNGRNGSSYDTGFNGILSVPLTAAFLKRNAGLKRVQTLDGRSQFFLERLLPFCQVVCL